MVTQTLERYIVGAMAFTTLIDTATLAARLDDPDFVIVDCRFKLDDIDWGRRVHADRSIPGAVFADVERDLSGPKTGANGRHPLPDPAALIHTLTRLGIGRRSQIVAFDQDAGMYASRLWWLLRWMGHTAAAVLDGGYAKWTAENRPTAPGIVPAANRDRPFEGTPQPGMTVSTAEISRLLHDPAWRLVDARAPERYRGEVEPIDPVAGHIPSAINRPFKANVDERNVFLAPEVLREQLQGSIGEVGLDHVVCYCGSGVTACQDILSFEHAGLRGVKLYAGSWSEWVSDPSRGVEKVES